MAYSATGTAGNDTLNQSSDTGPGTIAGLAGNDCIFAGSGLVSIAAGSGNDTIMLQTGNTGTADAGAENDRIFATGSVDSMILFAGDGADTVNMGMAAAGHTILGGNNQADGADSLVAGRGNDLVFGNGGDDTLNSNDGHDTLIGGFGNDCIYTPGSAFDDLVFGNEGHDTILVDSGNDTVFGGLGDDDLSGVYIAGDPLYFGNEGADTIRINNSGNGAFTILGGNDSADGGDYLVAAAGSAFVFGNGGADTVSSSEADDTVVGGFGSDSIVDFSGSNLLFGNEGDDTLVVESGPGANTVFGGLGNDFIRTGDVISGGADLVQGNEGNDTIFGARRIDTVSGGSGSDVFAYAEARDDGDNAAGGGPVERITDLNWAADRIQAFEPVAFAANIGTGTGADLNATANGAIAAAFARQWQRECERRRPVHVQRPYLPDDQSGHDIRHVRRCGRPPHRHHRRRRDDRHEQFHLTFGTRRPGLSLPGRLTALLRLRRRALSTLSHQQPEE